MKIALINSYFLPFEIGGAERSLFYLSKALREEGHAPIIITPNYGAKAYEEMDGIEVRRFRFPQRLKKGQQAKGFLLKNIAYHLYLSLKILDISKEEGIEIFHIQDSGSMVGALFASKLTGRPSYITIRDYSLICPYGFICYITGLKNISGCGILSFNCFLTYFKKYSRGLSFDKKFKFVMSFLFSLPDFYIKKNLLKRIRGIVFVSNAIKEVYLQRFRFTNAQNIEVLYNLPPEIDSRVQQEDFFVKKYNLQDKENIILFVGRNSIGKGIDLLKESMESIIESMPSAFFIFLGRGCGLIKRNFNKNNALFLDIVPNREVLGFINLCDVVVVPSQWPEPLSRVALEAMSLAKPVVATNVGGMPELIKDRINGFLIHKEDKGLLADRVLYLLKNRDIAKKMGEEGRVLVNLNFSKDRIIKKLIEFYNK